MGAKRSADDMDSVTPRPRREHLKRMKFSPTEEQSNSSDPSSCSVSEDSALRSSPPASEHTRHSSISSVQSPTPDEGSDSSVASSSDGNSSTESDSDEELVTVGWPKKPDMQQEGVTEGSYDIRSRLAQLLPQLAESNKMLASEQGGQSFEDVDEDEQHIEMDLGLGVLEEKEDDQNSSTFSDSSSDEDEVTIGEDAPVSSGAVKRVAEDKDTEIMAKLVGQRRRRTKPGIEELG